MDVALGLWLLAALLGFLLWRRDGKAALWAELKSAAWRSLVILPRIAVAILTAGFAAKLLCAAPIAHYIGRESGFSGVLIAAVIGSIIPAGPVISFPLVAVLSLAGAGTVQIVTFLTAWSVFAVHRVLTYEIPLMGPRFTAIRFAASIPLPFIAAALTEFYLTQLR